MQDTPTSIDVTYSLSFFLHKRESRGRKQVSRGIAFFTKQNKGDMIMKLSATITAGALLLFFWTTSGYSGQRELQGLLIGAGSGAIIGHAIGGDAESAIIGSALGGIVGLTAGGIYAGSYHRPTPKYHRNFHHRGYREHRDRHQKHYKHYRPSGKHYQDCRVIKKRIFKHGQSYFITKRICNDRNHYHRDRHYKHGRHQNYYSRY